MPVLDTGIQRCRHHADKLDCRIKSGKDRRARAAVVAKRALAGAGFRRVILEIEALPGDLAIRRGQIDE
jgi:hypothetical protein